MKDLLHATALKKRKIAATMRGGGVSWETGRQRALSII
jgi:hypothetical protein